MKYLKHENGFSLLEVSVAVAIMAVLTGLALTIAPNFMSNVSAKKTSYAECVTKQDSAARDLIDGTEPTVEPTCTPAATQ